jgi:hypothetical protein
MNYLPDSIYNIFEEFDNQVIVNGVVIQDSLRGKVVKPFGKGFDKSIIEDQKSLNKQNNQVPQLDPRPLVRVGFSWN